MLLWASVKLHELVTFVIGGDWGRDPSTDGDEFVDVYCIRGTELRHWEAERGRTAAHRKIKRSSLEKRQLHEGDLILEVSGGGPEQPVGRIERIDQQALSENSQHPKICTNFFRRLQITKEIESAFLTWYLKHFYQTGEITKYQAGSNNLRNLKYPEYEQLSVPLPPLNEQRRIVEKIETLFARLDRGEAALREVQKLLTRYRQSVLKAAVTGQLTADWRAENAYRLEHGRDLLEHILQTRRDIWEGRGKYKEPVEPDTTDLPELPEGWGWASLGQLVSKIEAGKNFRCEERPPENGEAGIVKISAVTWEDFNELESKTIIDEEQIKSAYQIRYGDLLISRANTLELVGATAVVEEISKRLQLSDKVLRLKCVVSVEYWLNYVLRSRLGRDQIEAFATGAQMSMRNISQKNLERIAIPLPTMEEMEYAVDLIRKSRAENDKLISFCTTELTRSVSLRQSILKDAFAGRLVPQDPNDEPASDLLARIQAEHEAAPKKKPRRKASA